jgi:hypothetical protein
MPSLSDTSSEDEQPQEQQCEQPFQQPQGSQYGQYYGYPSQQSYQPYGQQFGQSFEPFSQYYGSEYHGYPQGQQGGDDDEIHLAEVDPAVQERLLCTYSRRPRPPPADQAGTSSSIPPRRSGRFTSTTHVAG